MILNCNLQYFKQRTILGHIFGLSLYMAYLQIDIIWKDRSNANHQKSCDRKKNIIVKSLYILPLRSESKTFCLHYFVEEHSVHIHHFWVIHCIVVIVWILFSRNRHFENIFRIKTRIVCAPFYGINGLCSHVYSVYGRDGRRNMVMAMATVRGNWGGGEGQQKGWRAFWSSITDYWALNGNSHLSKTVWTRHVARETTTHFLVLRETLRTFTRCVKRTCRRLNWWQQFRGVRREGWSMVGGWPSTYKG